MRKSSALTVWRVVALGSMLGCGLLWLTRPSAEFPNRKEEALAPRTSWQATHSVAERAVLGTANLTLLNRALAQALTPESQCAALARLARFRGIDTPSIRQIATYTEPARPVDVRLCATVALGETQALAALAVLMELVDDTHLDVAENAVRAVGQFEVADARQALLRIARKGIDRLRIVGLTLLAERRDPEAVPLIGDWLATANVNLLDQLISILGTTHDPRALPILQRQLSQGPRSSQYTALTALGELGGAGATEILLSALETMPQLATVTLQALARTGSEDGRETLIDAAHGEYGAQASLAALQALAGQESDEVTTLMERALNSDTPGPRDTAIEYFAAHGVREAVPMLTRLATEGGQGVAWTAVQALARIGGPDVVTVVEQLARSPGVAGQAALEALSNMPGATASAQKVALEQLAKGGARAGPAMAILSRDSSDEGRAALIKAARGGDPNLSAQALGLLGQRRDAESLLTLSELASHGSTPAQRAAALSALSQSGHPSALAHLQAGLKDESPEVRAQAVQALSESSDPKLETSLLTASVDKDPNVVNAATSALAQLGTPPALARLEEIASSGDGQLTPQALHALAHAAPERAAKFAETLATSSDPQTCLAAAQISMMFPKPVATRILSSAFRNADPNVLRESASYLAQLGLSRRELTAILAPLWQNPHLPEDLRITLNEIINSAGN